MLVEQCHLAYMLSPSETMLWLSHRILHMHCNSVTSFAEGYLAICPHANGEGRWGLPSISLVPEVLDGNWQLPLPPRKPVCILYVSV